MRIVRERPVDRGSLPHRRRAERQAPPDDRLSLLPQRVTASTHADYFRFRVNDQVRDTGCSLHASADGAPSGLTPARAKVITNEETCARRPDRAGWRSRLLLYPGPGAGSGSRTLALGIGEGSELQPPLARVVIGGLLASLLITLLLVPVIYTLFEGGLGHLRQEPTGPTAAPAEAV